jgi:hypothetical protein
MTPWGQRNRGDTAGFAMVAIVLLGAGVWAVMHLRATDPRLFSLRSPRGRSVASLAAALNPQLEVVAFDQPLGTISMRDRGDGKVTLYRYNFDQSKNEFSISAPDGTGIRFKAGAPGPGSLELRYPGLAVKTGEAADRSTGWIPMYPDTILQSSGSITGKSEIAHIFSFVTPDDIGKVLSVYTRLFKQQVGCSVGSYATRRAMAAFMDRANATLPMNDPDYVLLALVQSHQEIACTAECPAGQVIAEGGRCMPRAVFAQASKKSKQHSARASNNWLWKD